MRCVTDASLADMARELRQKGIDCETCHMLMRNTKDSRIKIPDGEIAQFIRDAQGTVTLILMDHDLAEDCKFGRVHHAIAGCILRNQSPYVFSDMMNSRIGVPAKTNRCELR